MQDRLDSRFAQDPLGGDQRRNPRARPGAVGDVDRIDAVAVESQALVDRRLQVIAPRRNQLDARHPLLHLQAAGKARTLRLRRGGLLFHLLGCLAHDRGNACPRKRLDRAAHLADMVRRGAATAADRPGAKLHESQRIGGQVLGRAEIDLAVVDLLGNSGVRLRDERQARQADGPFERSEQAGRAGAAVHAQGNRAGRALGQGREHPLEGFAGDRFFLIRDGEGEGEGDARRFGHR